MPVTYNYFVDYYSKLEFCLKNEYSTVKMIGIPNFFVSKKNNATNLGFPFFEPKMIIK